MKTLNGKKVIFEGVGTAVITPFGDNGQVNYQQLEAILEFQIANHADAVVICGTTGEASTLKDDEHKECIRFAVEKVAGRIPVIAGTGGNETDYAIELSQYADAVGADALLLVTPYYNKTTPKGLVKNFFAIADVVSKPIILYNVPSRTGMNIPLSVYKELGKHENIVAAKEASGNISAIAELAAECGDCLSIYSGNDDQIVPILSLGGKGVISVLSNVMPQQTHQMCMEYFNGNVKESLRLQLDLLELMNHLFIEVNPIPVKTAMAAMGFCNGRMRLPLCEMEEKNKEILLTTLKKYQLL